MRLVRGAKLSIKGADGHIGPLRWTLLRDWFALKIVDENLEFRITDDGNWIKISECENFQKLPKNAANSEYYNSSDRSRLPITPSQLRYADVLNIPFRVSHLDKNLLAKLIVQWEELFPDLVDQELREACEQESGDLWKDLSATAKQLNSLGLDSGSSLTRGEASQMIGGEATEGQLRRLKFYQLPIPKNVSKSEASQLIDDYRNAHPEREQEYQDWKTKSALPKPRPKSASKIRKPKPFWVFWR